MFRYMLKISVGVSFGSSDRHIEKVDGEIGRLYQVGIKLWEDGIVAVEVKSNANHRGQRRDVRREVVGG